MILSVGVGEVRAVGAMEGRQPTYDELLAENAVLKGPVEQPPSASASRITGLGFAHSPNQPRPVRGIGPVTPARGSVVRYRASGRAGRPDPWKWVALSIPRT